MRLGEVCGKVWATKKLSALEGCRFALLKLLDDDAKLRQELLFAVDHIGSGVGDTVLVAQYGAARVALGENLPIDAAIIGIVDSIEMN